MFLDEKLRTKRLNVIKTAVFITLFALIACGTSWADTAPRYRVFNFRNISAQKAVDFLKQANLTVDCQIVQENIMSVTAGRQELAKASEVLRLIDSPIPYEVKIVTADAAAVPPSKKISSDLGNIQVGTLSNPPVGQQEKAIIEAVGNSCLIIAPQERMEQIVQMITQPESKTPAKNKQAKEITADVPEVNNLSGQQQAELIKPKTSAANLQKQNTESDFLDATELLKLKAQETTPVNITNVQTEDTKPIEDVLSKLQESLGKLTVSAPQPKNAELEKSFADVNIIPATKPAPKETSKPEAKVTPTFAQPTALARGGVVKPAAESSSELVDANQLITVSLPEKIPIVTLIGMISEYYHLNYVYDPAKVTGDIYVRLENKLEGKVKLGELYDLLETSLKSKDLIMTRRDNFVFIVPRAEFANVDPQLVESSTEKIDRGNIVITRIYKLNYIDVESVRNLLSGLGLGLDINTQAASAHYIIITEYAYRMPRVEDLINMVDKPGIPKQIRFRQLRYTMATALRDKVKTLADQLGTVSLTIARSAATPAPAGRGVPTPTPRPPVTPVPSPTAASVSPATEAQAVYIDIDDRTNRILMIGYEEKIDIVEGLINTLDVEQQDLRSLRLYEIQYADAQDVVTKLEQLGIISAGKARTTTSTTRTSTTRYAPGERITPAPTGAQPTVTPAIQPLAAAGQPEAGSLLSEEPQIIVIENTNSLLVNATKEQHLQIITIISYVDNEPKQATTNYVVYPLQSQDPEEMSKVLNQLIQETVEQRDATGKVVGSTTTKKTDEDIIIIPDKNTFSIICYASKKNQQWIESLIKNLDKRRPQVLIDVTLVEITKNDNFTLDVQSLTKYPSISTVGTKGNIALINPDPGMRIWEASAKSGSATAFYADDKIQALLTAVNTKNYGRVLAKPKLLVNDNELGTITTQQKQTIISPITSVIPGSAGTQSTASVGIQQNVYTAEIKLDITPHISEGELLRLEIQMTRTDFVPKDDYTIEIPGTGTTTGGTLKGPSPPDLLTSDVKTVITVPDDRTIILGGLDKLNQTKGGTKVPILGDLPLVGILFRKTANTDNQDRLYVFVKANILRPEEKGIESDIERISRENQDAFEKHEKEMQNYKDLPMIKPKPMDPRKILEPDVK